MKVPKVSVICLSHNHLDYVEEAILSVLNQTYPNIELIVVDDASTDGSADKIRGLKSIETSFLFLPLSENLGNCAAFNQGMERSTGDFIIDLSADDVLLPGRVASQVKLFGEISEEVGVVYSDAAYINGNGDILRYHFRGHKPRVSLDIIPVGDVYRDVLQRYVIAAPTMMIRRKVMEDLEGYDPKLAYEDFDFWVRSSRTYQYQYQNKVLTQIRVVKDSLSSRQHSGDPFHLRSTLRVCKKARDLNRGVQDQRALGNRLKYEFRNAIMLGRWKEARSFFELWNQVDPPSLKWKILNTLGPLVAGLRVHRLRSN